MTRALLRIASLLLVAGSACAQNAIALLDAGAEPRAPLRYQYQAGTTERVAMEMHMSMLREVNGELQPMATMPPIRTVMETRVAEVRADGSARVEMVTRSTEAAPSPTGAPQGRDLNESLAATSRLAAWFVVDTRGRTLEGQASQTPVAGPAPPSQGMMDSVLNEVNNGIHNEAGLFPEEAVGEGARWTITTSQVLMGITVQTVQEVTLRRRSGHIVELEMTSSGPALDTGSGALAGAPPMQQKSTMKGTTTVNLQRLNPAMTMLTDSEISTGAAGQAAPPMTMKSQMRVTLTPEVL